jgi:hypothetical protein
MPSDGPQGTPGHEELERDVIIVLPVAITKAYDASRALRMTPA